jgi:hypothetical protein
MKNENLSRLTYLAQAVVGEPTRFADFVEMIHASLDEPKEQQDAPELEEAVAALEQAWQRFVDHPPSLTEIVQVAGELEHRDREADRLAGIALSWAVENQLWRRQIENDEFDTQDVLVIDELSERAANARGL